MEYWSSGVLKRTGNRTEQKATTKTRSLPAANLAGYESTKEEGGYLNPPVFFRVFVVGFLLGGL
jgi:hypothetical protein